MAEEKSPQEIEYEEAYKLLVTTINRLSDHFDSIQLNATRHNNGRTQSFSIGEGNWFARRGVVQEWLQQHEDYMAAREIRKELRPADSE